jgi:hypothetical protein
MCPDQLLDIAQVVDPLLLGQLEPRCQRGARQGVLYDALGGIGR